MKYLLGQDGIQALEAFCMANALFAFDYDGTLAPIVEIPSDARMRESTTDLLDGVASLVPVALITGRSRDDVSRFLPAKIAYVVGNHGLEGIAGGSGVVNRAADSCQKWATHSLTDLDIEGVSLENKKYSLAVHYRMSPDKRQAKAKILAWAASLVPSPRIVMGKCVVNIVSPGAPHKGVALLELMLRADCRSAVYFGDDDNDEDVFRLGEESLLTVRVGKSDDSAAMFFLKNQAEMDDVLRLAQAALLKSGKVPRHDPAAKGDDESSGKA